MAVCTQLLSDPEVDVDRFILFSEAPFSRQHDSRVTIAAWA
jgi:hypothetical protein